MKRLLLLLPFVIALLSCKTPEPPEEGTIDSVLPQDDVRVYLYLDNTVSMKGYFMSDGTKDFSATINAVADFWKSQNAPIEAYYTESNSDGRKKETAITNVDFDTMQSNISNKNLHYTDSYEINRFFDHVVSKISAEGTSGIAFFFTDGILSGTNEEIKNNPSYNKDNSATLQARIADALRPLSGGKEFCYAAAIYRFESMFNGDYYKYNNKTSKINKRRPYFVIVVGDNNLVSRFDLAVQKGLQGFRPLNSLLFDKPQKPFGIATASSVESDAPQNVIKIRIEKDKDPVVFSFRTDMLPSYLIDTASANNTITIDFLRQTNIPISLKKKNLFFTINPDNGIDDQELNITVYDRMPYWVESNSNADDSFINNKADLRDVTTFLLINLVNGIKNGIYNGSGSEIYQQEKYIINTSK